MTEAPRTVDVLMATDLRFPGGTTASVVEECLAQHRAGYRTGLLHLPSPIQRPGDPFAPRIRSLVESGAAELVLDGPVHAKVLVIRHPSVLGAPPSWLPQVQAEHVLIVANQVPVDPRARAPYYDVLATQQAARAFGRREPVWAPIGPTVREALAPWAGQVPVLAEDWTNIVDVDAWYQPRGGGVSDRPVIGRHSRGHWSKWPATREDVLAAYPDDPRVTVRVLGGTEAPRDILGHLPANWVDLPFNSVTPAQFLASIDFLVYYHHPSLIEAFGRTVLEGLASGAVAVVDPSFEPTFGPACVYAGVREARAAIESLPPEGEAYRRQSALGVALVRERFSYEAHARRLADLIGPPEEATAPAAPGADAAQPSPRTLLLLPQAGTMPDAALLGAVAGPADDHAEALIVLLPASEAGHLPEHQVETIPAVAEQLAAGERARYLTARVTGLVATCAIGRVAVVGDAVWVRRALDPAIEVVAVRSTADGAAPAGERPSPWTLVEQPSAPAQAPARRTPQDLARRGANLLRQRAPRPVVGLGVRAKRAARTAHGQAVGRLMPAGVLRLRSTEVPALSTPPSPVGEERPTALFVVTAAGPPAEGAVAAIAERAVLSNAFRPVLLAPPVWIEAAHRSGLAIETLTPKDAIAAAYTSGWSGYFRRRLIEVVHAFQPAAAVSLTFEPSVPSVPSCSLDEALDIAESLSAQRST
ncbi:hypothetical protein LQF12_11910 [Ruania suaedae]|uniref:hypothetical protein n=1 Tax=Ruania suaedae TaxID=2897774 RepID=UPI001E3C38F7|nr:hypothetical protein [Ruania suaedae]UFU02210.1 hypothetical protein LQF12_11910 [Ruania suaedae]